MTLRKSAAHCFLALVCAMHMIGSWLHVFAHAACCETHSAFEIGHSHHSHHSHHDSAHHPKSEAHHGHDECHCEATSSWLAAVVHPFLHHHHDGPCPEESEYVASSSVRLNFNLNVDAALGAYQLVAVPVLQRLADEECCTGIDPPRRPPSLAFIETVQLLI